MSLTIEREEMENRQVGLTIGVDEKRVDKAMRALAKRLAKNMRVPGFRPGKAPFNVVVKRFGREGMRAQVVDDMLNDVVTEALEQEELTPYARPMLTDIETDNDVVLKLTVPLEPEVTLGDFREIRKELETVEISEEAVDEAVERFAESHAADDAVDRPAQAGDMVKVTGKSIIIPRDEDEAEDVLFDEEEGIEFLLDAEKTFAGTTFVDNLIGASVGDDLSFKITYAADYEVSDFAGREASFDLKVLEIKNRIVPEITEAFVQEHNHDSIEAMRAQFKDDLEKEAEAGVRSRLLDEWIEDLRGMAELDFPPSAVDQELDDRVENMKQQVTQYGWTWEDYLTSQDINVEDLREEWREEATDGFKNALVLREFIAQERLKVNDDDIQAAILEQISRFGDLQDMDESFRQSLIQTFMGPDAFQRTANELMMDVAYERIKMIVSGNAPDLDELEAAEEAARLAAEEAAAQALVEAAAAEAEADSSSADDDAEAEVEAEAEPVEEAVETEAEADAESDEPEESSEEDESNAE